MIAAMRYLEATSPIDTQYGRRLVDDLVAAGLADVEGQGRGEIVRGGGPPPAAFLRLTIEKVRAPPIDGRRGTQREFAGPLAVPADPDSSMMFPLTVAAWGRR